MNFSGAFYVACQPNKPKMPKFCEIQYYFLKKVSVGPASPRTTASPNLSNLLSFLKCAGFFFGNLFLVNIAACLTVICGVSFGGSPRRQGLVAFTLLLTPSTLTANFMTAGLMFPFLVMNEGEVLTYSCFPGKDCGG